MTVGKIYGGLLIFENWKTTKFGNVPFPKVTNKNHLYASLFVYFIV